MESGGNTLLGQPGFTQSDDHSVLCVSVQDAGAYADWLSRKTGRHYRLPTEAEWEYAARGQTDTARYWGDNPDEACRYANVADLDAKQKFSDWATHDCSDNHVFTAPVGSFLPNRYGLHDMLGNAWEWIQDCYHFDYKGAAPSDGGAWENGGSCDRRVVRGGSWYSLPRIVRSASRSGYAPDYRYDTLGFRLAQELEK